MVLWWLDSKLEQASEDLLNLLHGQWKITTKRSYTGHGTQKTKGTCVFTRRPARGEIRPMFRGFEEKSWSYEIVQTITETEVVEEDELPFALALPIMRRNVIQLQNDAGWRFDYTFPATHPDGARHLHVWPTRVRADSSALKDYCDTKRGLRPLVLVAQKSPLCPLRPEIHIQWDCSAGKKETWTIRYEFWEPEAEVMCTVEDVLER